VQRDGASWDVRGSGMLASGSGTLGSLASLNDTRHAALSSPNRMIVPADAPSAEPEWKPPGRN